MGYDEILSNPSSLVNASVPQFSADGRRIYNLTTPVIPPSPVKRRHTDDDSDAEHESLPNDDMSFQVDESVFLPNAAPETSKKKRYLSSDDPLKEWVDNVREEYLLELVLLEGPAQSNLTQCDRCLEDIEEGGLYRCKECFFGQLLCRMCLIETHEDNPLHSIERWNGDFFARSSLHDAGLKVHLGHPPGEACPLPSVVKEFVILHINGIHTLCVQFCMCDQVSIHGTGRQQLLRRRWFPATFDQPQTCATFCLLKHFQMQTLQAKTTSYDYYSALQKLTDNSGLVSLPMRYKEFMRMHREYSHLLALKRGGRAHDAAGIEATGSGALAVRCPACPDPLVNLPLNWQLHKNFMHTLYIALDACFRLKRRIISSSEKDPGLGVGWSYFVESEPFRKYLLSVTDQKEMSTCSGLAALDYANTKFSRGYASTGVCLAICARHEFVQPNGVADLQVGERYANMDYCFASALRHHSPLLKLLVSYDIACQWSKSVIERLKTLPPLIRLHLAMSWIRFAVPKLHIHSHTRQCQERYSLNYLPGVGQTDGEGVERPWANIGPMATSTRVMGPGARMETLNAHWGHWNWQKLVGLGSLLARRLRLALSEREIQKTSFAAVSSAQSNNIEEWKTMVENYEADSTCPNPYEAPDDTLSEKDIREELEKEDAEDVSQEPGRPLQASMFSFVSEGLDILDQQQRIKNMVLSSLSTSTQEENVADMRARLTKALAHFRALQSIYLPSAITVLQSRTVPEDEDVESVPILLPSALDPTSLSTCDVRLLRIEKRLHEARCTTSLNSLRNLLYIKSRLLSYKDRHVRHQGPNTRTRTLINRNEAKIKIQVTKFQTSWSSLKNLAQEDQSQIPWPPLTSSDVRCMQDPDIHDKRQVRRARASQRGQSNVLAVSLNPDSHAPQEQEVEDTEADVEVEEDEDSHVMGETSDSDAMEQALRVQWMKSRARSRRWSEEVILLKEEMRRTLVSLRHRARSWRSKQIPPSIHPRYHLGMSAYAHSQARLHDALADAFELMWKRGDNAEDVELANDEGE
ncbi:hypothetical protein ONZ45_g10817 [Pleurotus djamor]|nr:hypothetical protein ONZ45_g10817 [Pleurotus djamor]